VFLLTQTFRGREIQIAAGETTGVHKGNGAQKNNWQSNEFFVVRTIISKMKDCVTWQERLGRERDALGGPNGTIRR
jgi:hypothetical protein